MIHNYSLIIIKYKNKYLLYDDQSGNVNFL